MSSFASLISFYFDTVASFLMSEPIVYLFGAVVICFIIKIVKSMLNMGL